MQALRDLWEEFDVRSVPAVLERMRRELRQVIGERADTHRDAQAVQAAMRLLADLDRPPVTWEHPSSTPDERAGVDHWPFCCSPAHHSMEPFRVLDADDRATEGSRQPLEN